MAPLTKTYYPGRYAVTLAERDRLWVSKRLYTYFLPFLSRLFYNTTVSISNLLLVELCTSRFTARGALNFSAPTRPVFRRSIREFFGAYRKTDAKGRGIIERDPSILPAIFRAGPTKPPPSPTNRITAVRCPACPGVRMYGPTHTGQNIRECPTRNAIAKPFYDTDSFLLLRQTNPPPLSPPVSLPPSPNTRASRLRVVSAGSRRTSRDAGARKHGDRVSCFLIYRRQQWTPKKQKTKDGLFISVHCSRGVAP
ncbi:hypothetical protein ALC53_05494 [Atta colombica]|uniref:Uncharacterized protein n=1 Tax=Atta colombica TaxID=520822 RepID=A0A195BIC1_9HYME|nr:hypothetical protein ALC53_05494 [Atta colombica]